MLENIMRHVEDGVPPFQAALRGSREVGFTIISISSSLVAVFIPIFFMPGVIGLLFHEFAVIVSLAIVASAFVSLTLVPMLASRFLSDEAHKKRPGAIVRSFERGFNSLLAAYTRSLDVALRHRGIVLGSRAAHVRRHRLAVRDDPEGLLPGGGHRPAQDHDRGRRGHLVSGDGAAAEPDRLDRPRRSERARTSTRSTAASARRTPVACSST
jgi:multidrug efflux pump subunit AcrB